jgi:hypothetical protein
MMVQRVGSLFADRHEVTNVREEKKKEGIDTKSNNPRASF